MNNSDDPRPVKNSRLSLVDRLPIILTLADIASEAKEVDATKQDGQGTTIDTTTIVDKEKSVDVGTNFGLYSEKPEVSKLADDFATLKSPDVWLTDVHIQRTLLFNLHFTILIGLKYKNIHRTCISFRPQ